MTAPAVRAPAPLSVLARRHRDVAALCAMVAAGWSNARIGRRLHLSDEAVKSRLCRLYGEAGYLAPNCRTQLAARALIEGVITPEQVEGLRR